MNGEEAKEIYREIMPSVTEIYRTLGQKGYSLEEALTIIAKTFYFVAYSNSVSKEACAIIFDDAESVASALKDLIEKRV